MQAFFSLILLMSAQFTYADMLFEGDEVLPKTVSLPDYLISPGEKIISSKLRDSSKEDQKIILVNRQSLKCQPAQRVCSENGEWCSDYPISPAIASIKLDFSYFTKLNHRSSVLAVGESASGFDADVLCQKTQLILDRAKLTNGKAVADLNRSLYESVVMDITGMCLRVVHEKIELDLYDLKFSSEKAIILEKLANCPE